MLSLESLPVELILMIIQSVEDPSALNNLCKASKRLSAMAQPLLYCSIDLTYANEFNIAHSLLCLNRTTIDHPHIGSLIQRLDIDAVGAYHGIKAKLLQICGDDKKKIRGAFTRLVETHGIAETPGAMLWRPSSLSTLLISSAARLKELHIHVNQRSLALLVALGQKVNEGYSRLSEVRSLSLICAGTTQKEQIEFADIAPLFLLPRLSSISISGCSGGDRFSKSQLNICNLLPRTISVTLISITQSCVDAPNLDKLIHACKNLKVFAFSDRRKGKQQFGPTDLCSTLECQKNSLEDVRVSFETEDMTQMLDWDGCSYGSFEEYTCISFLELDGRFLTSSSIFPASLEYIVVQNCQSSVFGLLSLLAMLVKRRDLPFLRTVSIHANFYFPGGMLGLPLKGASDVAFRRSREQLVGLFQETDVLLLLESDLLDQTIMGYQFACEYGPAGYYGPFTCLE